MPQPFRDLAAALSMANLLYMPVWFELLFRPDAKVYFQNRPLAPVDHGAAILGVGLLTLVLWAAARLARSVRPGLLLPVGSVLFIAALALPLNAVRINVRLPFGVGRIWHWMHLHSLTLPFLVLGLLLLPVLARLLKPLHHTPSLLVLFTLPFAGVTLGHSALRMLSVSPPFPVGPKPPALGPASLPAGAPPRLLWLLFDELDWSMIGPKRPADLSLPALDRLLSESFVAERAEPPSAATMTSIPSLLTGRLVHAVHEEGPSELRLEFEPGEPGRPWSGEPSVLSRAREMGLRTAIVGWYHPYCRILTAQLDDCSFEPVFLSALARDDQPHLGSSLLAELQALSPFNNRRLGVESSRRILERAIAAASGAAPSLTFVHFSTPHAPVIYDRKSAAFTTTQISNVSGYLDNLALVDRTLGELRRTLESAHLWDGTTVLVTSDHAWRESWGFDGRQDIEVPFILKLAGARVPVRDPEPLRTVCTADLLLAIARGEIANAERVSGWLDERGSCRPGQGHPAAGP